MSLFKKAEAANNIVVLVRGQPGTYKTRFALGFKRICDKPIAYIGSDRGARLYADDPDIGGFHAIESRDLKVIKQAVAELAAGAYQDYGGIVIDTCTDLWEAELASRATQGPKGTFIPLRAYKPARDAHEELLRSLQALPLHVCFIMEEKPVFERVGQGEATELKEIGTVEDGNKKDSYVCDVRLRFFVKNGKFHGEVLKDRTGTFPMGKVIESPKAEMWIKGAAKAAAIPPQEMVMEPVSDDDPRTEAELRASVLIKRIAKIKNEFEMEAWKKKHADEINQLKTFTDLYESVIAAGRAKRSEFGEAA